MELYETPFRGYDPQIGRFWQVEPLADEFHSISMFQFGFNNPVSFNDPTGLDPTDPPGSRPCTTCGPYGGYLMTGGGSSSSGGGSNGGGSGNFSGWTGGGGGTLGGGLGGSGALQEPEAIEDHSATITIVNLDNNKALAASIKVLEQTFTKMPGANIKFRHVTSAEGLTQKDAAGINAVYLFGDKNKHYEQMYKAM